MTVEELTMSKAK